MPLYIVFIDLLKVFSLVSRKRLFQLLMKIGWHSLPQLLSIITSFHEKMQNVVSYDDEASGSFTIQSGVKEIAKLCKRICDNSQLALFTKLKVFQTCVLSSLLYDNETWMTYTRNESHLKSFYLHCLQCILSITWTYKFTNSALLEQVDSWSMHLLLWQSHL